MNTLFDMEKQKIMVIPLLNFVAVRAAYSNFSGGSALRGCLRFCGRPGAKSGKHFFLLLRAAKLQNAVFICTVITFVCSVGSPIFYGIEYMSVTGAGISIMLLISILFQAFANRPSQSAGS